MNKDSEDNHIEQQQHNISIAYIYQSTEANKTLTAVGGDVRIIGICINAYIATDGHLLASISDDNNQVFAQLNQSGHIEYFFPSNTSFLLREDEIIIISALSSGDKSWNKIFYYGDGALTSD